MTLGKVEGKIGVGIIGANPGRGWAGSAHIPALRSLQGYELRAVSTTRLESAEASARQFGVAHYYDNHQALVNDPEVDLVVVCVKVPYHHELVSAAIAAGKAVYCEWPLGNGLAEAVELAELARRANVLAVVGLQARTSPVVNYVRDLVRDGFVGRVLSTTLIGSGMQWGAEVDAPSVYLTDIRNGATMLTIPFGHSVDALCYCLGEFAEFSATMATGRPTIKIRGTGDAVTMTAADQLAVAGKLAGGAVASVQYKGGRSRGTNLLWEINGTEGDLLVSGAVGHVQLTALTLKGGQGAEQEVQAMPVPESYRHTEIGLPTSAINVAEAYRLIESDLRNGTRLAPGFDVAVSRHRMIEAVVEAAKSGARQKFA